MQSNIFYQTFRKMKDETSSKFSFLSKRSSKSHPRSSGTGLNSGSFNARARSTGRDPRLLDLMNSYNNNADVKSEVASVVSANSAISLQSFVSNWTITTGTVGSSVISGMSAPSQQGQGQYVHQPQQYYNFSGGHQDNDDSLSVVSMRSGVSSHGDTVSLVSSNPGVSAASLVSGVKAPSLVTSSHLSVNDSGGCKRKFSSIAEAISDSDGDIDDEISAKRPRTPVVDNPQHKKFSSWWEKWKVLQKTVIWIVLRLLGLAFLIIGLVLIYTFVRNVGCTNLR